MKTTQTLLINSILLFICTNLTSELYTQPNEGFYEFMTDWYNTHPIDTASDAAPRSGFEKKYDRTFQEWAERLYPHGDFSIAANAIYTYTQSSNGSGTNCDGLDINWEPKGPFGHPGAVNSGAALASGNGQVHRIRFSPSYDGTINRDVYACTYWGGLWKSSDAGQSWDVLNTDYLPTTSVQDIAIDYSNENNLYICTGNGDLGIAFDYSSWGANPVYTHGVYKSVDAGETWNSINDGLLDDFINGGSIRQIKIDPANSDKLIAATSEGIFICNNASASDPIWSNSSSGINNDDFQLRGLELKPDDSNILYTAGQDIYTSINGGASWSSMTGAGTGLDFSSIPGLTVHRINLAVSEDAPERLYAYVIGDINGGSLRGYIYMFDGTSWDLYHQQSGGGQNAFSQAWIGIEVNPYDANEVFFSHTKVLRTPNILTDPFSTISPYSGNGYHADTHHLEYEPVPSSRRLFAAHHGGISIKDVNVSGNSGWTNASEGLQVNIIWSFDYLRGEKDVFALALQDCGVSISEFQTEGPEYQTIVYGDGYSARFPYTSNDKLFYSIGGSHLNSSDYFDIPFSFKAEYPDLPSDAYWNSQGFDIGMMVPQTLKTQINPTTGKPIFGFTELYERIKAENESGDQSDDLWEVESDIGKSENVSWKRQIHDFRISNTTPQVVYIIDVGDSEPQFLDPGDYTPTRFYRSTAGLNDNDYSLDKFQDLTSNIEDVGDEEVPPVITGVEIHPTNPDIVWLSFSGYSETYKILKSIDGGLTWSDDDPSGSLPNLPANDVIYQKGSSNRVFLATDAGVFYKEDGMDCWARYGNMPHTRVVELDINYCSGKILAATFGRGVWQGDILQSDEVVVHEIIVDGNEVWDDRYLEQHVRITQNGSLTITGLVQMPKDGKIIIEPGGSLLVNAGTLTNSCDELWQGIEVWGNSNASQTPSNQGVLKVINGALVENARNAVTLWKPDDWSKTGGIIQASNSTFRNNRRSVEFMSYQNEQVNGAIASNRSYFKNCTFETNDDCIIPEEQNAFMITMWQVSGVGIWGCEFNFDRTVSTAGYLRGAIGTSDANFRVDNYCNEILQIGEPCPVESTTHSTFTGFNKAIYASGAEQNVGPSITDAVFDKNMIGIEFDAVIAPSATFNDFTVGNNEFPPVNDQSPLFHLGIHTNNCDEYILEENTVEGDDANGWLTHGIYVFDDMYSANSNVIYKNTYDDVSSATIASGLHADPDDTYSYIGLKFICNSNQNNNQDFEVRGWGADVDFSEINNFQDDGPATSAGNSFSAGNGGDGIYTHLDFYSNVTYEYNFDPGSTDPDDDEIYIPSPATIELMEANNLSSCETNFPEDDGKIDVGFQLGKFSSNKEEFNNLYYSYLQLIDEGNTDGMISEIDLTWPEDAWDLHAELMSRSPYNSESVLKAAADKNVLTHGMLLEILLANPDALRSGTVINHVENNIANPLPPYMIDILYLAASNPQTVRTEMERNLSSLHQEFVSSHKLILNHHLNDTINALHPDTLINWFSQIKNLSGRYQQIFAYTGVNQYTNAFAVIDTIQTNYKLSNKQHQELTNAEDFVSFLETIYNDGRNVAQITPSELPELERVANEIPGGVAAERAENILCFHYNICADEPGAPKNNGTKSRRVKVEDPQELIDNLTDLRVKPNPADQYIELEYEVLESSKENILRVFDTNGRLIEMWNLGTTAKGIKVLDTRELPNGVYYFEIVQDTRQLKSGKFIVQH